MQEKRPKVSVVMPLYNAEAYIEQAICSVKAQSMEDWELIVIDDGSSDASLEIAQAFAAEDSRIQVLRNEQNMGVSRTRNRGIALSRGEYIALLDSDDVWYPEKLRCQLARMAEEKADFCYSSYAIIGADGGKVKGDYLVPEQITFEEMLRENVFCCSSMIARAEVFQKIGFREDFYHEDYVFGLQVLQDGYRAAGCKELLLGWRYIENSRSFNKVKSAQNRWRIYREYLKLPFVRSVSLFVSYTFSGLRKYGRKSR